MMSYQDEDVDEDLPTYDIMRHAIQPRCLGYDVMRYTAEDVQDLPTDTTTRHVLSKTSWSR